MACADDVKDLYKIPERPVDEEADRLGSILKSPPPETGGGAGMLSVPGATRSHNVAASPIRSPKHRFCSTLSSHSAVFSQLPCLGLWKTSILSMTLRLFVPLPA